MPQHDPQGDPSESVHRFPQGPALLGGLFAVGYAAVCIAVVVSGLSEEEVEMSGGAVAMVAIFAGQAVAALWLGHHVWKLSRTGVRADDAGLHSLEPVRPDLQVGWSDVQRVTPRPVWRRLDVHRPQGEPLRLPYRLEDFDRLLDRIAERAPRAGRARPLPAYFGGPFWTEITESEVAVTGGRRFPLRELERPHLRMVRDEFWGYRSEGLQLRVHRGDGEVQTLDAAQSQMFDALRTLESALSAARGHTSG